MVQLVHSFVIVFNTVNRLSIRETTGWLSIDPNLNQEIFRPGHPGGVGSYFLLVRSYRLSRVKTKEHGWVTLCCLRNCLVGLCWLSTAVCMVDWSDGCVGVTSNGNWVLD